MSLAAFVACGILAITLVAAVVPVFYARWFGPSTPPPSYATGERVDVPAEVFSHGERTLIVFARSGCPACDRSVETLRAAVGTFADARQSAALVVTGPSSAGFAAKVGISEDRTYVVGSESLRLRLVPTVVVVDARGTVLFQREGEFQEADIARLALIE